MHRGHAGALLVPRPHILPPAASGRGAFQADPSFPLLDGSEAAAPDPDVRGGGRKEEEKENHGGGCNSELWRELAGLNGPPIVLRRPLSAHGTAAAGANEQGEGFEESEPRGRGGAAEECPVCQEGFRAGQLVTVLPCEHAFHADCAEQWLRRKATCPVCRAGVLRGLRAAAARLQVAAHRSTNVE